QLYVGTTGTSFYQIHSQDFETNTTTGAVIASGYESGYSYQETTDYDSQSHNSHVIQPYRDHSAYVVSVERIENGTTTGITGAQVYDDGESEIISEAVIGECTPSTKGLGDDTGEDPAKLLFEDGNTYNIADQETMEIDKWSTGDVNGEITKVVLWVNFTVADDKYDGSDYIQYAKEGEVYQDTNIQPHKDNNTVRAYYVLTDDISINSLAELQDLNVRFNNNDSPPKASVNFDRMWLEVTYIGIIENPIYELQVEQDITAIPFAIDSSYELWIYGNYTAPVGTDLLNVEVKNTEGMWETLGEIQCEKSPGWNRYILDRDRHLIDVGGGLRKITLRYHDTVPDLNPSALSIDGVEVRKYDSGTTYNTDLHYSFIWPGNEGDVKNISIYDVRSDNPGINTYILDWDATPSPQWVILSANATFNIDGSYVNHTYILNSNCDRFIHANGSIKIRYYGSSSDQALKIDYLGVNIHRSSSVGTNQQINVVYDIQDFQGDKSTVAQIIVVDSSFTTSGKVEAQIFNYTNQNWISCFTVNETEMPHTAAFSTSPSDFISDNPGNILIRYRFSDNAPTTLNIDYLQVEITYTAENGGGGGGTSNGGDGGDGGDGGKTILQTLIMYVVYQERIEKYSEAEIDLKLTDETGKTVRKANITLAVNNKTTPFLMEEKEDQYRLLFTTDELETGNHTFVVSVKRSGFGDLLSSAFQFKVVVTYPFVTVVRHPSYFPRVMENPIPLFLDPTFYILPFLMILGSVLQVTTFASISPEKLRSMYIFTPEGQGIYYRTFDKKGIDSQLTSAALSGVINLIMEATSSDEPMRTVDQGQFEIFIEYGRVVIIAVFVEKKTLNKRKIRKGQKDLVEMIEEKYEPILSAWDGNLSSFYEMDQLVLDAFDFKTTRDLEKLMFDAAKVQEALMKLYAKQEKYHMSERALRNAYKLYSKIKSYQAQLVLETWKAFEKGFVLDYFHPTKTIQHAFVSKFFSLLDSINTPWVLKILAKIRNSIY
ncbi:MAG: hypothetical protein ACFFDC_20765, partial [Promethearchaeota archaeon]